MTWRARLAKLASIAPLPLIVFVALKSMGEPIRPEDLWGHLAMGREILARGEIPQTDSFSLTRAGAAYFDQPWLAQIFMVSVHRVAGLAGLLSLDFALMLFAEALVVLAAMRRGASFVTAALVQFALGEVAVRGWAMRPQALVVPIFAAFVLVLTSHRAGSDKPRLWALPLLMVLWANLHGSFPLGIVLVLSTLVAMLVDGQRNFRPLAVTALGCIVAPLANPRGFALFIYVARLLGDPSHSTGREWRPVTATDGEGIYILGAIAIAAFIALRKRAPMGDIVLAAPFVVLELFAVRNGIWLSLVLGPMVAGWLTREPTAPVPRTLPIAAAFAAVLMLTPWVKPHLLARPNGPLAWEPRTPIRAARALAADPHPPARLFEGTGFGTYLLWGVPSQPVFVDYRLELYSRDYWDDVFALQRGEDVDALLLRYRIDGLLVDRHEESSLDRAIRERPEFELRYEDEDAAYFARRP